MSSHGVAANATSAGRNEPMGARRHAPKADEPMIPTHKAKCRLIRFGHSRSAASCRTHAPQQTACPSRRTRLILFCSSWRGRSFGSCAGPSTTERYSIANEIVTVVKLKTFGRFQTGVIVSFGSAQIAAEHPGVMRCLRGRPGRMRSNDKGSIAEQHHPSEHSLGHHDIDDCLHKSIGSRCDQLREHRMDLAPGKLAYFGDQR